MAVSLSPSARVRADGKFFRLGTGKFPIKGVAYGTFGRNSLGDPFPEPDQAATDFALIRALNANVLRVYHLPPAWLLELAAQHALKLLVDVPWNKHVCFLDSPKARREARDMVRAGARSCAHHPAVFALSVVNEIPADIVRWHGARAVSRFIDELIADAKSIDDGLMCTFANFPPTEYLHAESSDFALFNVYLHDPAALDGYLARLQSLADTKPLVLGECGIDSIRESEARQAAMLRWQIETAFRNGLAGTVLFSFTDDWVKNDRRVEDWAFGLTTRQRAPKEAFAVVQQQFAAAPYFQNGSLPKVSVVVATYNGARTLKACLESLARLNYPDYEVVLVDDGSTDNTPQIVAEFAEKAGPFFRFLRQANEGLSAARNTGIAAATGEVVAFTDDDCRADEDWLHYLVGDLLRGDFAGIGGHNFLPTDDSPVAAAVMASPGGPAHVMLNDREAEHVPGCNMAFWKHALVEISGFDPIFTKAGDDVDVCWRLQERGRHLGFSPAGVVWHCRRSTVPAYFKQQSGYGEAEALLRQRHPDRFNTAGHAKWRGQIYAPAKSTLGLIGPVIYHGPFASGFFQTIYAPAPSLALLWLTCLEFHLIVTLPLVALGAVFRWLWPLAGLSLAASLGASIAAAVQADVPRRQKRWWSRFLIALLFFLQPIARGWARHRDRLTLTPQR
jgi:GT2 family glycosyltransferase